VIESIAFKKIYFRKVKSTDSYKHSFKNMIERAFGPIIRNPLLSRKLA